MTISVQGAGGTAPPPSLLDTPSAEWSDPLSGRSIYLKRMVDLTSVFSITEVNIAPAISTTTNQQLFNSNISRWGFMLANPTATNFWLSTRQNIATPTGIRLLNTNSPLIFTFDQMGPLVNLPWWFGADANIAAFTVWVFSLRK